MTDVPTKCVTTFVTATVVDPCDAPTSLTGFQQADKTYYIGDSADAFVHGTFTPDPSYCTVEYTYSLPALQNNNTPITAVANTKTITIDYIADLTPITDGPAFGVKIIGTVKSKYGNVNALTITEVPFTVTFQNPCISSDRVFVNSIGTPLSDQTYTIE